MTCHKIIIHGTAQNLALAARAATRVLAPAYQWQPNNITAIGYRRVDGTFEALFSIKRNKSSITLWEQSDAP